MASLENARELAASVRFRGDEVQRHTSAQTGPLIHRHHDEMLLEGLLISHAVTPVLERSLQAVCDRLYLPRSSVNAFVWNNPAVQADCVIVDESFCILRFTSGLVNLMTAREAMFVIGHELAHFLFLHVPLKSQTTGDPSLEGYAAERSRELSADRIGLIGCGDLNPAARAIIKTASGLDEKHLRFDVSAFLRQALQLNTDSVALSGVSTHPSLLVRCRALMWFSMQCGNHISEKTLDENSRIEVDKKVCLDLKRFENVRLEKKKTKLLEDLALWEAALLIIDKGGFKKSYQSRFLEVFGRDNLESFKSFLGNSNPVFLKKNILAKRMGVISELDSDLPMASSSIVEEASERARYIVKG